MIQKYCVNIFLVIVFIIILFNLKQNLYDNFKNNSNSILDNIEKFDDGTMKEHNIRDIDQKINQELADNIKTIYDEIKDTAEDSLKNNIDSLYNRANTLYDKIAENKKVCENEYDADSYAIIKGYDVIQNKKCLKPFSDILEGKYTLPDCAKRCDVNENCLSFSHDKDNNDCRLSTICHNNNQSTIQNFNNNLYIKEEHNDKVGTSGAYIQNYKLDKDTQCNNLCHNDIIGSSSIIDNVHICAEKCEEKDSGDNKCSSFEYNFSNKECTLRKKCQQGTHLINSNEYKCDKGQINNEEILRKISFNIDGNRNLSDSVLEYYSELELKKKCNKKCEDDVECHAFGYEFTPTENNCTLYKNRRNNIDINVEKDISQKFNNICIKPKSINRIEKNLYTKKDSIPEVTQCEALCEENVNDKSQYIKFYKEANDINYSYISFGNMYNIKELPDFKLSEYKYIGIKYGYKISFLDNENYVSIQKEFLNPDEYNINIDELKVSIHDDNVNEPNNYSNQWRSKINVILIEKLERDCRGKMSQCTYNPTEGKYEKTFNLFHGDENDLNECRQEAIQNHGEGIANLYFPSSEVVECVDDNINCSGYWDECVVDSSDGKYKRTWKETAPLNGDGACQDVFGNNIFSEGLSGCGTGANEAYNIGSGNIKVNCVPNNYTAPFLGESDGYYKDTGSSGSSNIQYYNSNGVEDNPGSSIGTSIIPDANIVCSRQ